MNKQSQGFTLVELVVVMAIAGIAMTIAVPSYNQFVLNNRMTAQANEFLAGLNFARGEAAKRNATVSACRSSNSTSCAASGGWDQGYIIFVDTGSVGTWNAGDTILQVQQKFAGKSALTSATLNSVSFLPSGQVTTAGTFSLCSGAYGISGRSITISSVGRPVVTSTAPC
jgi:type IV fimbrial biogenesis protein FimT